MLLNTSRSWDVLAARLAPVARVVGPAAQTLCTAANTPQRKLPLEGPGLADFIAGSSLDRLPPASSSCLPPAAGDVAAGSSAAAASSQQSSVPKSVLIETYGCQMNVSDSEIISSVLADDQYTRASSAHEAAVVLLNTCAIRENAEARIWGRLGELQALKKKRRAQKQPPLVVGVLGCMAERLKSQLLDQQRLADLVVGPDAYRDLPRILAAVQAGEAQGSAAMNVQLSLEETYADIMPVRQDASTSAFVSIMRGCNHMCTYCIVPFTRGRERSRPIDSILREVEALAQQGVKEVTLLGQNVNSYADFSHLQQQQQQSTGSHQVQANGGSSSSSDQQRQQQQEVYYAPGFASVYKPKRQGSVGFAELLERVASVNPEMRVRFTSPHPKDFTDDVLGVIAALPNVCNYLHMPAQSGSSSVLSRMRRGYTRAAYDALVQRARQVVPNVALSTDIIAGFCGETEEEHLATVDLLRNTRYDNAFIFSYSERAKTYASRHLADDVPAEVKSRRLAELFAAYRQGQAELNQLEVGRVHLALLDGSRPRRDGQNKLQGRSCSMKRVIIPEQPVPSSLSTLQQHCQQGFGLWLSTLNPNTAGPSLFTGDPSSCRVSVWPAAAEAAGDKAEQEAAAEAAGYFRPLPGMQLYQGPVSSLRTGDYVAVLVQQVVGSSTLLCAPLAKTSIQEFDAIMGTSIVGPDGLPGWMAQLAAAGLPGHGHSEPAAGHAEQCMVEA